MVSAGRGGCRRPAPRSVARRARAGYARAAASLLHPLQAAATRSPQVHSGTATHCTEHLFTLNTTTNAAVGQATGPRVQGVSVSDTHSVAYAVLAAAARCSWSPNEASMRPGTLNRQESLDASRTTRGCTLHCMWTLGEAACSSFLARLPASSAACSRMTSSLRKREAQFSEWYAQSCQCDEGRKIAAIDKAVDQRLQSLRRQLVLHACIPCTTRGAS